MIRQIEDAPDLVEPEPLAGPDHPIRTVTREVAFEAGWSTGRARKIGELFDEMASEWHDSHSDEVRVAPVRDGLARGGVDGGHWLELGAGTGAGTALLAPVAERAVAVDLSAKMLAGGPFTVPRVQADASKLPFPDGRFDGVLMVNMLLFPDEVDRVLQPDGKVLWVNTLGDRTPIHLPPADVVEALPGDWQGVWANAGSGFWLLASRRD